MKKYLLLLLFVSIQSALLAQLTLSVNMSFEPDPDVLNWAAHPETVQMTVTNTSAQTLEYKYLGRLTLNGQLVLDNDPGKMPTETIGPFETRISFAEDVFPSEAVDIHGNSVETYMKTNTIPGGHYLICIKLINLNGQDLSPDDCKPFQITRYQQPSLIFPISSSPVTSIVRPVFSWSPVVPMPLFPVTYRLRVVEIPEITRSWVPTDEPGYHKEPRWGSKEWMPKLLTIHEAGGTIAEYEAAVGVEIFYREDRTVTGVWRQAAHPCQCTRCRPSSARNAHDQLSSDALRALNYGFPLIDVEVGNQTQYQWPMDMPDPLAGRSYVWSVQAFHSDNGLPIGDNEGLSQPAQFFVTEDTNNPLPGPKAPDIIIADENGCLYGCTGNVWQPIDCPTERSFSSPGTYPSTFLLTSTEEGSEKKWFLVDETTIGEPLTKGPMLPISRFALVDEDVLSTARSSSLPKYLDPKTAIITGGGGTKLCWRPPPEGCVVVGDDEACPDIMGTYLIDVVTTPNGSQITDKSVKQSVITLEQLQPFLLESVKDDAPMFLSLDHKGKLSNVKSLMECTGDYCIVISDTGTDGSTQYPTGDPPKFCFKILPHWPNAMKPMNVEDPPLCNLKFLIPDVEFGSIVIREPDGTSLCLKIDGTIVECGELPSAKELKHFVEEAKAQSEVTSSFSKGELLDFYLHDIYSDSGFVKFRPRQDQRVSENAEVVYVSADPRYKDLPVVFKPNNSEVEQWEIGETQGSRTPICVTVVCCDEGGNGSFCRTVSCYSKCDPEECCDLFGDWLNKTNLSDTHGHPSGFDPACLLCQKFKINEGANDISLQVDKVNPEIKNDKDIPAGVNRVKPSDKHQKAVLDFVKGMPIAGGDPDDDWTEIETPETIVLCVQNGKVSPINSCRNCPGNCLVLKKIMYHGSEDSFSGLRQMDGGKECLKCKKGDCPDHNIGDGKPYFRIIDINNTIIGKPGYLSSSPILLALSPKGDLQKINTEVECPVGYFLLTLEPAPTESNPIRG